MGHDAGGMGVGLYHLVGGNCRSRVAWRLALETNFKINKLDYTGHERACR